MKIPSVQKLDEGSYQCVVSNCAGSQISTAAKLYIGRNLTSAKYMNISAFFLFLLTADPPQVTTHPQGLKEAIPGQPVTFTVHATGTEPLKYEWRWTLVGSGDESEKEEWQRCDRRSDTSTLTISSVQKANEGSYHCVVSNCAGSQFSEPAILTVGKYSISTTLCMCK